MKNRYLVKTTFWYLYDKRVKGHITESLITEIKGDLDYELMMDSVHIKIMEKYNAPMYKIISITLDKISLLTDIDIPDELKTRSYESDNKE